MPVLRIGAAALAAAVVLCTFPGCASDIEEADATERILLFSGVELSRTGGFLFGGFVWSPHGINAGGFAMKTLAGGSRATFGGSLCPTRWRTRGQAGRPLERATQRA